MNINNIDYGLLTTYFIALLQKGDNFFIGDCEYEVSAIKKEQIEISPSTLYPLTKKITLQSSKQRIILEYIGGIYSSGIKSKSRRNIAANNAHSLLRDIEGIIVLDKINRNNPFHEPSKIFKILGERISQISFAI